MEETLDEDEVLGSLIARSSPSSTSDSESSRFFFDLDDFFFDFLGADEWNFGARCRGGRLEEEAFFEVCFGSADGGAGFGRLEEDAEADWAVDDMEGAGSAPSALGAGVVGRVPLESLSMRPLSSSSSSFFAFSTSVMRREN